MSNHKYVTQINKSIFNGIWLPGETGYTGYSFIPRHFVSESKTLLTIFGRSYGLVHHTPVNNSYNLPVCANLFWHFTIKWNKYNDNMDLVSSRIISLYQLNDKGKDGFLTAYTRDGKYVGDLKWAIYLLQKGIDPETLDNSGTNTTCCIGYCPSEQKWYGWSYRAIYGFGIGYKVKKGDCAYQPSTLDDWIKSCKDFYEKPLATIDTVKDELILSDEDGEGLCTHISLSEFKPGKGEWEAKTLDDAKQMARDFAESVS